MAGALSKRNRGRKVRGTTCTPNFNARQKYLQASALETDTEDAPMPSWEVLNLVYFRAARQGIDERYKFAQTNAPCSP
jgi:hypothetical protein